MPNGGDGRNPDKAQRGPIKNIKFFSRPISEDMK